MNQSPSGANMVQVYKIKIATTCYPDNCDLISYSKRDSNPHSRNGQRILSPSCLPFHHSSFLAETGLCSGPEILRSRQQAFVVPLRPLKFSAGKDSAYSRKNNMALLRFFALRGIEGDGALRLCRCGATCLCVPTAPLSWV